MSTVEISEPSAGVRLLTLNRPDRLNALSAELMTELKAALDEIDLDNTVRSVVLTGAGRGFCAGLDLKGFGDIPGTDGVGRVPTGMRLQQFIAERIVHLRSIRKPIIAAVNGPAAGGGFALACASDIRICSESARFNAAFVRIGLSGCDVGVSWILPRIVGTSTAFEMMLTGRLIDADEALRTGLVSRVVPDDAIVDTALEVAEQIAANSPFGVWMTKEVMWSNLEVSSWRAGIDLENRTQILASQTADATEARSAFLERRDPGFQFG